MQTEMNNILLAILKEHPQKNSTLKKEVQTALPLIEEYQGKEKEFYEYVKEKKLTQLPFVKSIQEIPVKNRLFFRSLQILHKLITRNSISKEFIPYILEEFEKKIESHSEVQLRVLQMLQPLIEDPLLVKGDNLLKLFKIGISLIKKYKDTVTAKITVSYVIECIFERPEIICGFKEYDTNLKESAEEDCLKIVSMLINLSKEPDLFGLDLLLVSMSSKTARNVLNTTEGKELLEVIIDFLMKEISGVDINRTKVSFAIFMRIISNIVQSNHNTISILLGICQLEIQKETELLKGEFLYALPYEIVLECLKSSEYLSEELFGLNNERFLLDITGIQKNEEILKLIQAKEKTEIVGNKSLKMSRIIDIAGRLEDSDILQLFIPYFSYLIENITCSSENWPEEQFAMIKSAISHTASIAQGNISVFNSVIKSVYTVAEKYPKIFFISAFELTFCYADILCTWGEFFILASYVQDSAPDLDSWNASVNRLMECNSECLKGALKGVCGSCSIPLDRFMNLFLSVGHKIEDFPYEVIAYIKKIFVPGMDGSKLVREEQVVYFLSEYFSAGLGEGVHVRILPEIILVFSEIKNLNQDISLAKIIMQSISDGIKQAGSSFGMGWVSIYKILSDAAEEEEIRRIVFETIKTITDRMLMYLPDECLVSTHRLLCMCCKLIIEDNISFQALFSIRDITEYVHIEKERISRQVQMEIFYATMCLLCSVAYDQRDDVRDSAIVQAFETIYFCQKVNLLMWEPLIQIFLKRLLSAAVYTKEKEIYSGEHDENSSGSDYLSFEEKCLCRGVGGCSFQPYTTDDVNTARSLESAKKIIFGVSNLIFSYFGEIKEYKGFYSLWRYTGRIFVRFFSDPYMKGTVISAITPGLQISLPTKYSVSLFSTISDICFIYTQPDESLETLVEMFKQAYKKIRPKEVQTKMSVTFFKTITHLLKNNTVEDSGTLTFLEFEAIQSLRDETCRTSRIKVLLEWIAIPRMHSERLSEQFIIQCIEKLENELLSHAEPQPTEIIRKSIDALLLYHKKKETHMHCWHRAIGCLQKILQLEVSTESLGHLSLISREIFRLPSSEDSNASVDAMPDTPRKDPHRLKEEERGIQDHLVFLEMLTEILKGEKVVEVYTVVMAFWEFTIKENLHILHLSATKTLCHILASKHELNEYSDDWIDRCLQNYNECIRVERVKFSFFQRQAILYVLQQIIDRKLPVPKSKVFMFQLILCISSDAPDISLLATEVLEHFVANK
ncbi:hypothetical protein NEIG_00489 [Nematocida sp. ERTm5]|nr:hypothetical protein NEIG_00489 [Nematocida sp. ERTm5]